MSATVLVVDDNPWACGMLCAALQKHGYDTERAASLVDVRQLQRRAGPGWRADLVLVELVREHGNGFTVAAWLQSQDLGEVVLLSERNDVADRLWARSRGILHLMSRAGGVDQLCARMNDILTGGDERPLAQDAGPVR